MVIAGSRSHSAEGSGRSARMTAAALVRGLGMPVAEPNHVLGGAAPRKAQARVVEMLGSTAVAGRRTTPRRLAGL